jgi:predicted acylesterase/phospholipase RssA/CRP-like cAMP-binding protein
VIEEPASSSLGTLRSDLPELLKGVPVLSGLPEELRNAVADRATITTLPAGEWLFHQGDVGDAMFLVLSGRVEVVFEDPVHELVRVLGRGRVVGELALLTEAPRSAGVRARRDTELLALDRMRFVEFLTEEPRFALSLARELGMQLRTSRALEPPKSDSPATIALVPLVAEARFHEVREVLRAALERCGPIAELRRSEDAASYGPMLDRAERDSERVLLPTGNPSAADDWTAFCLRQSDRTVVVAEETGSDSAVPDMLRGADLLLLASDDRPPASVPLLSTLEPRTVHVVRAGARFHADLARVARRLSGRSVGVVLSGGGARAFCHIGVLQELLDAGLAIDRVGGCSMGAYVGGMCAMEMNPAAIRDRCHEEFVVRSVTSDYTVPLVALLRGRRALEMLDNTFGTARIETQPRDYFCISADLISGQLVEHRSGLLAEAVGSSMCLPGVFRPRPAPDRLLVDGGVLNNLPVQQMASGGEGPVIAVDVTAEFTAPERGPSRFRRTRTRAWATRARRFVVGADEPLPSFIETLARSVSVGSTPAVDAARRQADALIAPDTGEVAMLDFGRLDEMIAIGRRAAADALAAETPLPGL